MKALFHGGVHPAEKKELIQSRMPQAVQPPERVVIPMRQHIGAACTPLVREGDYVFAGQKIGDGEGLCVPVHASVSGSVVAVAEAPHPSGGTCLAVSIENDHRNALCPELAPHPDPESLAPERFFALLREAGISGMGGAGFPTAAKAEGAAGRIDTLIINACECEPYLTADDVLLCAHPRRVLRGALLLANVLQPRRLYLAVEDNKPEAIAALREAADKYPQVQLKILPARYPQGAEKQLILALTGCELVFGKLPVDVGCAVFNAATAAAVYSALVEGMPLTSRIVSISGEGVKQPQNFVVPIGTPFANLIRAAGGLAGQEILLLAGGPMMGLAQTTPDVPVIKTTGAVLCLPAREEVRHPECIRCGRCIDACPMLLQPLYLYRYAMGENAAMLGRFRLFDCIECGCCSYVCPGRLPLAAHFRTAKRAVKEGKFR